MESIPVYYLLVRTTFLRKGGDWHPVTDTWSQPRPLTKTIMKLQVLFLLFMTRLQKRYITDVYHYQQPLAILENFQFDY